MTADSARAAELINDSFADHLSTGALVSDPDWDSYAVLISTDDSDGVETLRVVGFSFTGTEPAQRRAIGTVGEVERYRLLREETVRPDGSAWTACVFVLDRDSAAGTVRYLYGAEAAPFTGEALDSAELGESLRPQPSDFR